MRRLFYDDLGMRMWPVIVGSALFLAALVGLCIWASNHDEATCRGKGGHIVSHTGTGVGVGANGQVVTVVTTNSECVVPQ